MESFQHALEDIMAKGAAKDAKPEDQLVRTTLEGINTIIESQKGKKIPTAYFAVGLSTLKGESVDEKAKAAILSFLATILSHVPVAVIKSTQNDFSSTLVKMLSENFNSTNVQLLKSLIQCAAHVAKVQTDPQSTARPEIQQLFQTLLSFALDTRPKLRSASHKGIQQVLGSLKASVRAPLSNTVSTFITKSLQKVSYKDPKDALNLLALVKDIIFLLSTNNMVDVCESLFKMLTTVKNPQVTALVMQCLESLFVPPEEFDAEDDKETAVTELSIDFLKPIITSLFEVQPNVSDSLPATSYMQLITKAFLGLHRIDSQECMRELPRYFKSLMASFTSNKPEIQNAAFQCFREIIMHCIDKSAVQAAVSSVTSGAERKTTPLEKAISILMEGMKFIYKDSWSTIFELYAILFQVIGAGSHPLLVDLLKSLGELYDSEFHTPQFSVALRNALGAAVSAMGPEKFLSVLPMNLSERLDAPDSRVWLLPMFKQHIISTELQFFAKHFLPLATQLQQRANKEEQSGSAVAAKNYMILYYQIWDLFPSFATYPTDLVTSFKALAKALGNMLTNDASLRKCICEGLINLIEKNRGVANSSWSESQVQFPITPQQAQQNLTSIAVFAKNFLPILFNIYSVVPPEETATVHRAIESFVSISETSVVNTFFKNVVSKFLEATTQKSEKEERMDTEKTEEDKQKYALADLTVPFAKFLNPENVNFLYKSIKPLFKSKDATLQKKAYKILDAILEGHSQFIRDQLGPLTKLFTDTTVDCVPSAKKMRMRCLKSVVLQLGEDNVKFIPAVLADVIITTRESNAKAREMAETTINAMAMKMAGNIQKFVVMIVAGLAGQTPHMIGASLVVLANLIKHFESSLDETFVHQLLKPTITLLTSNNRDIIKCDLDFLRACIASIPPEVFAPHVADLVKAIMAIHPDERKHCRTPIRFIFERLLKKYGYDTIIVHIPESEQKFINHIVKMQRRKDRKKKEQKENPSQKGIQKDEDEDILAGESSDEEEEEEVDMGADEKDAFIIENEEPIDLMDVSAIKRVVSAQPKQRKQVTVQKEKVKFEEQDGKIVVPDDKKAKRRQEMEAMEQDILEGTDNTKSKRKRSANVEDEDAQEATEDQPKKKTGPWPVSKVASKRQKNNQNSKHSGTDFKSSKGAGDILKDGKLQPYAYLPLNRKMLNRRKQQKAATEFKNLVSAAKKGAKAKPTRRNLRKRS